MIPKKKYAKKATAIGKSYRIYYKPLCKKRLCKSLVQNDSVKRLPQQAKGTEKKIRTYYCKFWATQIPNCNTKKTSKDIVLRL